VKLRGSVTKARDAMRNATRRLLTPFRSTKDADEKLAFAVAELNHVLKERRKSR